MKPSRARYALLICAGVLGALLASTALAQKMMRNIPYTSIGGQQLGDLYLPAGDGPFPAIVYLHGGSWRSGNKSGFRKLATDLAAKGYVGFSINYDLHPDSFPISWDEAEAAIRFVRSHASEYHVDPDKIVVAGTSAGGELAALVALAPQGPAVAAKNSSVTSDATPDTVAAAVILNGVFNLNSSAHVITRYLGGDCEKVQPACADATPLEHVHNDAPPFFVGHGTADHTVAYAEAEAFVTALREHHDAVTLYTANGGPHMYWTKKKFYAANLAAVESFLSSALHPAAAP